MRSLKLLAGSVAVAALVALPVSSASAYCYRPRPHDGCFILALPFCVAGAVVGAAATVATAPLVVAGSVLSPRPWPGYYYGRPRPCYAYYQRPWAYYGGPYAGPYDAPRAAYYPGSPYYGPPSGYAVQRPSPDYAYYGPPRDYDGPPPGYGGPPPGY
jgi:hypothetical protein